ncbi:MAG TPA: right-handed parallel beta-helix repeat-containing protein [Blastocatellia bacterium]|nr:right-handed parallel beta-helix repeat-containing protein [Blastocatellia bacterium]
MRRPFDCLKLLAWGRALPARCALVALLAAISPELAAAQGCNKIQPAGAGLNDAPKINECLLTKGKAKLKAGTFLLYTPIIFPRNASAKLLGKGMDKTRLVVQSDCRTPWPLVAAQQPGAYQPVIHALRSPGAVISNLEINVGNLRKDCGYIGNYTILINRSPGSQVSGVLISGSPYSARGYTTGGANGGGILVANSENSIIRNNLIRDVGFEKENGSTSVGGSGIAVENSGNTIVEANRILRVAFGIKVTNFSPLFGYDGDSSGTVVAGNEIIGAAAINCPDCSQGRALKLTACGVGDEPPLRNLTIRDNVARDFGGANFVQGGSGLDLVCGVQYSTFENNRFFGDATAEFGLQIRSSFLSPPHATHHNRFAGNTFVSGSGRAVCNTECADVNFTPDGPDQIGMRRNGENRFGTNNIASLRKATDRGCNEHSHAFFLYLNGREYVRHGESILLAASGVRPGRIVTFRFRRGDGAEVAVYRSLSANRNCIMNQEMFLIDAERFPPGEYQVFADYEDGNSDAIILNDPIKTLTVRANNGQ